ARYHNPLRFPKSQSARPGSAPPPSLPGGVHHLMAQNIITPEMVVVKYCRRILCTNQMLIAWNMERLLVKSSLRRMPSR
ncbi:hypothetical protein KIN20_011615, partial [Parelaphostrongylus tenuis]